MLPWFSQFISIPFITAKLTNQIQIFTDKDAITCLTTEGYVEDNELVADVIDSESPKEDDDNLDTFVKGITDLVDTEAIDANKCVREMMTAIQDKLCYIGSENAHN